MVPSPLPRMLSKLKGEKWKGLTPDVAESACDLIPNRVLLLRKTDILGKNVSEMALATDKLRLLMSMFDIQKFGLQPVKPGEEFYCDLWEIFSIFSRKFGMNKMIIIFKWKKNLKFPVTIHVGT